VGSIEFDVNKLTALELQIPEGVQLPSSSTVNKVPPFPPQQLMFLFSADDWEEFLLEWGSFQKNEYELVTRLGGANDMGVDVACFRSKNGFLGEWDNYQCKHYGPPITPQVAIPEIGKILWHIFEGHLTEPKNYYFFAPKDCGPSLKKLLLNAIDLKKKLFDDWDKWCSTSITKTEKILLEGNFRAFVENFDFTIFKYKPKLDVIEEHRKTPYFAGRFGGGLPDRPISKLPPVNPSGAETRYLEQLMEAYSDHEKLQVKNENLGKYPKLEKHFHRQREAFYHAESLQSFARDSVPEGTYEELQEEVYQGVVDIEESSHADGFQRVKEVMGTAAILGLSANGLIQVVKVQDRHGICHQLANEDRLTWRKDDE
jgi:C-terminal domain 6 of the ABC-three component (ABC-3C) systems